MQLKVSYFLPTLHISRDRRRRRRRRHVCCCYRNFRPHDVSSCLHSVFRHCLPFTHVPWHPVHCPELKFGPTLRFNVQKGECRATSIGAFKYLPVTDAWSLTPGCSIFTFDMHSYKRPVVIQKPVRGLLMDALSIPY